MTFPPSSQTFFIQLFQGIKYFISERAASNAGKLFCAANREL
jgi:hypothetical protein